MTYKLLGTNKLRNELILPGPYTNEEFVSNDFIRKQPNVDKFKFLIINEANKKIVFKSGNWSIEKDLIIPKGYKVFAYEGLELNLFNSAKILSFSPIQFVGVKDNPIVISSDNYSGQGAFCYASE